eukprot:gnl/Chilomastix_caulleri/5455.p1 GENE.gnl/Chilomastix_caulleri/5455~~gnl/Chilomastix_caulleri/5455.p1  ORF type:complete len:87 (-),score=2.06 gnl/Chilomastix_caulleri/5455:43-303(-)
MLDFSNSIVLMILLGQYTSFTETFIYGADREDATSNLLYANIVLSIVLFVVSPPIGVFIDRYYIRVPNYCGDNHWLLNCINGPLFC